ncbi:MAG TPA: GNAT family N-acetyltransferase [Galbitalea sp.]|nr:GNAT family N-acetyltransferase [Galbitalea sp.]
MSDSPPSTPDWVARLIEHARAADGAPPFSDQSLVDFRVGTRELVAIDQDAAALVGETDAEFVVDPDARGRGLGTELLETLLAGGATLFWAHGDAAAARALAASHGLSPVRELLHFVGEVSITPGSAAATRPEVDEDQPSPEVDEDQPSGRVVVDEGGGVIETFVPNEDEDEWVALNAAIFANHPEQGSVTRADLEQLETESWFRADNFLVLRRDGRMIGYCWLKVEGDRGEFYVVGVSPEHHGEKLGSLLFDAGLDRLRELGIHASHLYVEADNAAALRLYRSRGFSQDSIDIQYATNS